MRGCKRTSPATTRRPQDVPQADIPDSTGVTGFDMLESAIRRTHLTPDDPDGSEDNHD